MAKTEGRICCVDTNVWVFAQHEESPWHKKAREAVEHLELLGILPALTGQIVREFIVVVTHPANLSQPLTSQEAVEKAKSMVQNILYLEESTSSRDRLLNLIDRYGVAGKQVHDANIVAVMLENGVTELLTHNPDDFTRFADIAVHNMETFLEE
jgi:predicted nucleic acid-binding protein